MSSKPANPTPTKAKAVQPFLVLFTGILAVSTASILIRFAQQEVSSLAVAAWRIVLASLLIAPIALKRQGQELRTLRRQDWYWLVLSGVFLALHFACWITSLEYTTVAASVVLVTTTPLWVALFAVIILREKFSKILQAGLSLALIGGIVVGMGESCMFKDGSLICVDLQTFLGGEQLVGNLLALAGALFAAAYLLIGKKLRANVSLLSYTFLVYGSAGIILLLLAIGFGEQLWGFPPLTYLVLLALAVIPQIIGHSSFNWALRYLSATFVSVALLGEPIGSTILAYLLLAETPSELVILGGILILIGIYMASVASARGKNSSGT